jgi:hypothetical protein
MVGRKDSGRRVEKYGAKQIFSFKGRKGKKKSGYIPQRIRKW